MAKTSPKNVAKAIHASLKGKTGKELEAALEMSVKFLAKKNLLGKAHQILKFVEELENEEHHVITAKVESAGALKEDVREKLKEVLLYRYKAKDVAMEFKEDKTLLGGIRIEALDEVLDLSLKNKVGKLQKHLIEN